MTLADFFRSLQKEPAKRGLFFSLWLLAFLFSCTTAEEQSHRYEGQTMGTTYHVTVVASTVPDDLGEAIFAALHQVDLAMSNWKEDSDVSHINRSPAGFIEISAATREVLSLSKQIHAWTDGAFDPTLGALIEAWGFATKERAGFPDPDTIDQLLRTHRFDAFSLSGTTVEKKSASLSLNLSAIAKGYGVDQVAAMLKSRGFHRFLVEVGGEIVVSGTNAQQAPWRIGIETPKRQSETGPLERAVFDVAHLTEGAMATSGNYRIYFEHQGKYYSHIIDPRTGYPTTSKVLSATVVAPDCATADALATAFMILDPDQSLALCHRLPGVDCLILSGDPSTALEHYQTFFSAGMHTYLSTDGNHH